MSRKIVVALGGNAILSSDPSAQAQQEALVETAKHLVKLIKNGDELIHHHSRKWSSSREPFAPTLGSKL